MKIIKTSLFLFLAAGLMAGCTKISNAPAISKINKNGRYLVVVNETQTALGYVISSSNSVIECEVDGQCKELKVFVDGEEN
ncbi:MAG: hypothetical protein GY866_30285 [Proteobacteria bacterium]|nr:hypothetical protein [Pseudomonadota bacterium]